MEDIYVDVRGLEIEKLFERDLVSVDELLDKLDELKYENEVLEEKYHDLERDIEENYRAIPKAEQYEVYDSDFI